LPLSALISLFCAVTVFASGADTVVTLGYLNGTYASQLETSFTQRLSGLDASYQSALAKLGSQSGGDPAAAGWNAADAFRTVIYPRAGETVTLSAGSGLMWYSGAGSANRMLLDVTAGAELAAGGALTAGHRYLAEQETVVTASASSSCAAQGLWKSNATGTPPPTSPFSDVPVGEWYFEPVLYVVERSLFNGTGDGAFSPMGTMDRAMLVTVLYRLAGQPEVSGENPFTDVKDGQWYTKAIIWAVRSGIVTGATPTTFQPDTPVSREQIALQFYRFAASRGLNVSQRADLTAYTDHTLVSGYARDSLSWAVGAGLFQGAGGKLNPGSSATRCEVAVLFQRLDQLLSGA